MPPEPPEAPDDGGEGTDAEGEDKIGEVLFDPPPPGPLPPQPPPPPPKFYIRGQPVSVIAERIEYLDADGKLVTETLRDYSRKTIRAQYASMDDSLRRWTAAERKQAVVDELAAEGLLLEPLLDELGKELDPFDLICHIAFDRPPLTRRERAASVKKRDVFTRYGPQARAVLEELLAKYQDEGLVGELDNVKMLEIPPFSAMGTPLQLIQPFGGKAGFQQAVHELQAALYQESA